MRYRHPSKPAIVTLTPEQSTFLGGLLLRKHEVDKVYSGRRGCMCGCLGTYSATPVGHAARLRNMAVSVDTPLLEVDDNRTGPTPYFYVQLADSERVYCVYFKEPQPAPPPPEFTLADLYEQLGG